MQSLPEPGRAAGASILAILLSVPLAGAGWQAPRPEKVSFEQEVLPLFQQKCHHCHGSSQQNSGLDLRTREDVLRGGLQGPAMVPGEPQESRLYRRAAGLEEPSMPLDGRLSGDEIEILRRWIAEGAEWDNQPMPGTVSSHRPAPEQPVARSDREWWSFQKPSRPPIPRVETADWNRNPVDAFLMKSHQEIGLQPAPRADRSTLIRRAYLDLLGLLPTPDEVALFLSDESEDAFSRLVERLLDSPHYGERWGRHWLDVARYGDSGGYEHDYDYPNAWRYRDYCTVRKVHDVNSQGFSLSFRMARPHIQLQLPEDDREILRSWLRASKTRRSLAERAELILLCGQGLTATQVSERLSKRLLTVQKWRRRYLQQGLSGLEDQPRSGRPRKLAPAKVRAILKATVQRVPCESTFWSVRLMAEYAGVSRIRSLRSGRRPT